MSSDNAIREAATRAFDISFAVGQVQDYLYGAISQVEHQLTRPSVLFKPELSADGTMWMALLGPDLAVGIAGFGHTPAEAMAAFDEAFLKERTPAARSKANAEASKGSNDHG